MRRLVVISGKSKFIAIFAAMALSLTSIHLAAKAHIASLHREQEQLEKTTLSSQPSAASQISNLRSIEKNAPLPAKPSMAAVSSANPAPKRQIIISIADRQLAVIDHGQVLKTYPIAVGARGTPSPDGDFVIINHAKDPIYRGGDMEVPPGKDNPLGYALDGSELERLWHPRNQCAEFRWQSGIAWLLPDAQTGCGRALYAGTGWRHSDGPS